jgi:hypothetical protein
MIDRSEPLTDKERLLFGAGFVFGVAFTMLILAMVTVAVVPGVGERLLASEVVLTLGAGVFFAAIVGASLFLLAFPENRIEIPVRDVLGRDGDDER